MLLSKLAGLGVFARPPRCGRRRRRRSPPPAPAVCCRPRQHGVAVAINAISPLDIPDGTARVAADDEDGVDLDVCRRDRPHHDDPGHGDG